MLIVGHRGAAGYEPENTVRSFEKAIALGAAWVECDVFRVEDELLVLHDARLERTTNGTGLVWNRSVDYIRSLDAGRGERVPTLAEVLALVRGRVGINIELKGPGTARPVVELLRDPAWAAVRRDGALLLSSFRHRELAVVRALDPVLPVAPLFFRNTSRWSGIARRLGAYSINVAVPLVSHRLVRRCHERGLGVWVYTVNDADLAVRLRSLGVDAVFTDYPDRMAPRQE